MAVKQRIAGGAARGWRRCDLPTWHCHDPTGQQCQNMRGSGPADSVGPCPQGPRMSRSYFLHAFPNAPGDPPGVPAIIVKRYFRISLC